MSDQSPPVPSTGEVGLDDLIAEILAGAQGQTQVDPWAAFTSQFADPNMAVFTGSRLATRPRTPPKTGLAGIAQSMAGALTGGDRDLDPRSRNGLDWLPDLLGASGEGKDVGVKVADYTSVGDLLKEFYTWEPERLTEVQKLLYAGGFYGNVSIDAVPWGDPDENTYQAWATAVTRAARFLQSGQKITVDQVLRKAAKVGFTSGRLGREGREVTLDDPVALAETVDAAAKALLGRKANPDEQRLFVGMVHDLQRAQGREPSTITTLDQLEAAIGGLSDEGEQTAIDPGARALSFIRERDPTGVAAHGVLERAEEFFAALDGVV